MTDLSLDYCAVDGDDWETGPQRSVDLAEAVERATSSPFFLVRAVTRALLAVEAGLVPTRRRARRARRGVQRVSAFTAVPVTLLHRGPARFVAQSRKLGAPAVADLISRSRSLRAIAAEFGRAPATFAKAVSNMV